MKMNKAPGTEPIRLSIGETEHQQSVMTLVVAALGNDAMAAARLIKRGGLWVGKKRVCDPAALVEMGDHITMRRPPTGVYTTITFDPQWIIYEDADLIALNKPAEMYVEMTPWDVESNLRVALHRFLLERDGEDPKLHLAHRLDYGTSGVLLLSKNPQVNARLQKSFVKNIVHKNYLCLCVGEPNEDQFELATGHGRSAFGIFRVYAFDEIGRELPNGSHVKPMTTRFEIRQRLGDATMLYAFPHTGRTHQIRLHLTYLGHPLIGDTRYGGPAIWRGQAIPHHLLHANRMTLPHPNADHELVLEAPPPLWVPA
ncbi:MAG: hypothetical protein GFH27_549305n85 [Chloroflexi bacterium AL-W]|nr:hypothetical protein [Chloroflexi bacterium AL-N1]NOK69331.1 hypothetical protein [Chloroflexi bacterium AL-N10]NOK76392.1 hypothetical protein [Chloroflexi bacterium AL-N5]NOK83509.1 hypothetical protein [Chloroflexi bacterium AL-W]NOK91169.1 hypothetical protein [Chloroflexi bacterium AL-N15]